MTSRNVARLFATAALTALLAATASAASGVALSPPGSTGTTGSLVERIELPNGFQPEGITIDAHGTAYLGSLADGDIFAADVRSGAGEVIAQGPGTPSVGLKVDQRGRLFIAGGPSGTARVVDADTGELLATYQLTAGPTFVNDVVLTRSAAWFTDSQQAQLYKLPLSPSGELPAADEVETLPLTGEWMQQEGFNANGIAQTPDRHALLVIQSVTGTLFRVDPGTGEAAAVDLGGVALNNGDGLLVVGRTLYVVQNQLNLVAVIELDAAGTSGELVDQLTSSEFDVPTTVAAYADSLFLPNARFGTPPTPDTNYQVTRIDR
jgi:sugar lactone lactonase YvrE